MRLTAEGSPCLQGRRQQRGSLFGAGCVCGPDERGRRLGSTIEVGAQTRSSRQLRQRAHAADHRRCSTSSAPPIVLSQSLSRFSTYAVGKQRHASFRSSAAAAKLIHVMFCKSSLHLHCLAALASPCHQREISGSIGIACNHQQTRAQQLARAPYRWLRIGTLPGPRDPAARRSSLQRPQTTLRAALRCVTADKHGARLACHRRREGVHEAALLSSQYACPQERADGGGANPHVGAPKKKKRRRKPRAAKPPSL